MNYYELLVMLRSATTESQIDSFELALKKTLEPLSGDVSKIDRWGKLKLAFPIEHKDYAHFVLCRFTIPAVNVTTMNQEVSKLLRIKLNSTVIRYVLLAISKDEFDSSYRKPEAFVPSSAGPFINRSTGNFDKSSSFGKKTSNGFAGATGVQDLEDESVELSE